RELLAEERPLLDFYIQEKVRQAGKSHHARSEVLDQVAELLVGQPETVLEHYRMKLGGAVGVRPETVQERIQAATRKARNRRAAGSSPPARSDAGPDSVASQGSQVHRPEQAISAPEGQLIRLLAQDLEEVAREVETFSAVDWVEHPELRTVVSRFLDAARKGAQPTATQLVLHIGDPGVKDRVYSALGDSESQLETAQLRQASSECLNRLYDGHLSRERSEISRELASGQADLSQQAVLSQRILEIDRERDKLREHLQSLK
ncbi:MAG: hypothetical protein VX498_10015, partial [Myxococcota bacterium]|nr:hypothetical protein [Myxococcota bacterium]